MLHELCYCYAFVVIVIAAVFLAQIISGFRLRAMAPQPLGRFSAICCLENKIWTNLPAIISSLFQFVSLQNQDLDKICNELYFTLKVTNCQSSHHSVCLSKKGFGIKEGNNHKIFFFQTSQYVNV